MMGRCGRRLKGGWLMTEQVRQDLATFAYVLCLVAWGFAMDYFWGLNDQD